MRSGTAHRVGTHGTRRGPTRRRRRHIIWWVLGLAVVGWIVVCGVTLEVAAHRLQTGVTFSKDVRQRLSVAQLTSGAAEPDLDAATANFSAAHHLLNAPWLIPLRHVPIVGRQVASATALDRAALTVSEAGRSALPQVRTALSEPRLTPQARAAVILRLAAVVATVHRQVAHVSLGPTKGLISVLAHSRDTFADDLAKLQTGLGRADGVTAALADLLGGSRTYLVLSANNAEMRAGSGMFLAAGTLQTHAGALTLGHFSATSDLVLQAPSAPLTGTLAALWGFENPNQDFRNLALSPQFPANAALAAQMWQVRTGIHVDGVLVVDTAALSEVLAATGPVSADGITVNSGNVERYLLHDQYIGSSDDETEEARHDRQGDLAAATFNALSNGHPDLGALGGDLDAAANGRHILAWSATPAIEADWQAAGVGGQLDPDEMLLAVLNQGANKLDPFLSVQATMTFDHSGADTDVAVTVKVTNTTPPNQPPYIAGDAGTPPVPNTYAGAISLDIPGAAGRERVDGPLPLEAEGPDFSSFAMASPIQVRVGQSVTVTFHFALLGASGALLIAPSARIPATTWTVGRQRFTDSTSHVVTF